MITPKWLLLAVIAATPPSTLRAAEVIDAKTYHLRSGTVPEWQEFANKTPEGKRLDVRFNATRNATEATLFIRQDNVKLDWRVEVNGTRLANLFLMEEPLVWAVTIPAGTLRNGANTLSIVPPKENDDIFVGPFRIEPRPKDDALGGVLEVEVSDADSGAPLPCRLTVIDSDGALAAIRNAGPEFLAVRPGVVYTGNGKARLGSMSGDYTVIASRGFEYSIATQRVSIASSGGSPVQLKIRREVPTSGLIASDTHIHTFTHAKHGDATIDERMLTLAGEGIELPISTEHNVLIDFGEIAKRRGVEKYFTPVLGCEVTTSAGHFNVFPIQPGSAPPDHRITDWPKLMQSIRGTPGVQMAILNHPQDLHTGFVPFASTNLNSASGENLRGFDFSFDAVELINSGALRTDLMEVYRNWFSLLNYGYRITGVGASDSHDVSRFIVGQGRTYVACDDADPGRLNISNAVANMVQGRSYILLGLLPLIKVDGRFGPGALAQSSADKHKVEITVLGPSWVNADKVELYQNGVVMAEWKIAPTNAVEKARIEFEALRLPYDVHLVAVASGPGVRSLHWAIPRPYQPSSPIWQSRVFGSSNPVWVDNDGDGRFTPAREYARGLVEKHFQNPKELVKALKHFDQTISTQAASLLRAKGVNLARPDIRELITNADPWVKEGFATYAAAVDRKL